MSRNRGVLYAGLVGIVSGAMIRHIILRGGVRFAWDMIEVGILFVVVSGVWWVMNWLRGDTMRLKGTLAVFCEQCGKSIEPGDPVVDSDRGYYCSLECKRLHYMIEKGAACARCYSTEMISCSECGEPCCMNEECMYCPECDYRRQLP